MQTGCVYIEMVLTYLTNQMCGYLSIFHLIDTKFSLVKFLFFSLLCVLCVNEHNLILGFFHLLCLAIFGCHNGTQTDKIIHLSAKIRTTQTMVLASYTMKTSGFLWLYPLICIFYIKLFGIVRLVCVCVCLMGKFHEITCYFCFPFSFH